MLNLDHYLCDVLSCTDGKQAFTVFEKYLAAMGFDRVRFDLMTDHPSLERKAGFGVLRNYPETWMSYYSEQGFQAIDPVCQHLVNSNQPFLWSDIERNAPFTKKQTKLMREAEIAGLYSGVGLGIRSNRQEIVGMGFASSAPLKVSRPILHILGVLAHEFHATYTELERKIQPREKTINLSPMEKEILKWLSQHKSKADIAQIIKKEPVSVHTIDTHLRRIYQKLGVTCRQEAAVKACMLGML